MDDVTRLAEMIRNARAMVAFSGAGISTESGIPDFRSPGGVWSRNKPVLFDEFLRSRGARAQYWRMRMEAYRDFSNAKPNVGHHTLVKLETAGRLKAVITQNIDGLHQLAGSKRVVELHGTARIVACIACGREWPPEVVHARIEAGDEAPDCEDCGNPLKSKTISFGQALPVAAMRDAEEFVNGCDLMLAMGSSLVVEPAASIPRLAVRRGARLVIINREPTPLDELAELIIRNPIGETMTRTAAALSLD